MDASDKEWVARQESSHVNKADWFRGDWDDEPDRVEWRYSGTPRFPLLIVRGPSGALCGYVGVPPGHPYHGKDYDDADVSVHGGLTYARACVEGGHICHVARNGESDEVWWLGFDCAPAGDYSSMSYTRLRSAGTFEPSGHERYWTIHAVRREVEHLADQLSRVAKGLPTQEE